MRSLFSFGVFYPANAPTHSAQSFLTIHSALFSPPHMSVVLFVMVTPHSLADFHGARQVQASPL